MRFQQGFTLIEVLVATAIFAVVGIAAQAIFSTVLDTNALSERRFAQLEQLQRTMLIMERDILQATPRSARIEGVSNELVIAGGADILDSQGDGLALVKAGWHNPRLVLPRSSLQAVGYRLQDKELQRVYFTHVDNVAGSEPKYRVMLEDVEDFQVQFFVPNGSEPEVSPGDWEDNYRGSELPLAVAIEIHTTAFGVIRREWLVRGPR